jgi:formate hydrogenlyase subunit 4
MNLLLSLVTQVLHVALMIAAAPLAFGVTQWLEPGFSGRAGPPVLLPWRDLVRQSRKTQVETGAGSVVLRHAPAAAFGATLAAAALVPSFTTGMALSPLADILAIVSLLTVARVAEMLGALDAGAAVPGLAAQQSSAMTVPSEAALIVAAFALALLGGGFNLDAVINQVRDTGLAPGSAAALVLSTLLALAVVDGGASRSGLDEVTSGAGLAVTRQTSWLRRLVWFDLIGAVFLPFGLATAASGPIEWAIGLACWGVKTSVFVVGLAAIRAFAGRLSSRRVPQVGAVAVLLGVIAVVVVLASVRLA